MDIQPGQTLGPYRVINQVGQGGMATVYKAYHAAMDRYVAIKVLPRQLAQSSEFLGRFQQEARVIAKLEHAHILPVHDYGESDGFTYLVMRFLDAGTLKDQLKAGGLSLHEVDRFFTQLAEALDYAHSQGVIHRDLKPSNVLVDARDNLFLTDFGIAKLLEGDAHFTNTGGLMGTPAYMSPEQAQGNTVDQRSDIYSLGIILYEMVTGRVPFEAETPLAVVLKHITDPLPLPTTVKPDLAPAIERVLLRALAKNPEERFVSVSEFLAAWKHALTEADTLYAPTAPPRLPHSPSAAAPPAASAPPPASPSPAPTLLAPPSAPATPKKRSNWAWLGGGLAALCLVALCGLASLNLLGRMLERAQETASVNLAETATPVVVLRATPTPRDEAATLPPPTDSGPTEATFTNWPGSSVIFAITEFQDQIVTGGPGSVGFWSKDGELLNLISTHNGLSDPNVNIVRTDPNDGALWIGNGYGLTRYDGETWQYFNEGEGNLDGSNMVALAWTSRGLLAGSQYTDQPGSGLYLYENARWVAFPGFPSAYEDAAELATFVHAIVEDTHGRLWVGTASGLGRLEGDTWVRFTTTDGLSDNYITTLFADETGVWIGSYAGITRWDEAAGTFVAVTDIPNTAIFGITRAADGDLWVAGGGGLMRQNAAGRWTTYEYTQLSSYTQFQLYATSDGAVYFGSDNGFGRWTEANGFDLWNVPNHPRFAGYGRILPAPDGSLWFIREYGTDADRYDPATEQWSPVTDLPGLPLAFDENQQLWAALYQEGVQVVTPKGKDHKISAEQGLPTDYNIIGVVFAPDGLAWLVTEHNGIVRYDPAQNSVVDSLTAESVGLLSDEMVTVMRDDDDQMWALTERGLSRYNAEGEWTHFVEADDTPFQVTLSDMAFDDEGGVWVTTYGQGAFYYDGEYWNHYSADDPGPGLPSDDINTVAVAPDGNVWFGFYYGTAARFDGDTWRALSVEEGLISWQVNDIWAADNGIWFATSSGITRLTGDW